MLGEVIQFKENSYRIQILFFQFNRPVKKIAHYQRIKSAFSHKYDRAEFMLS